MKKIVCKPIESIQIELNDKEYICSFNMIAMANMQEELGKLDCNLDEISPARMASMILYSGIKANEPDFTMDEAVALAMNMGPANYGEVMSIYSEAVTNSMNAEEKAMQKKLMAQYVASVMK